MAIKDQRYTASTYEIVKAIREIPLGKVDTYGRIADRAGLINGARQVVRVLSSLGERENLPWHRVVNKQGVIALKGESSHIQQALLTTEGVVVENGVVDLAIYLFRQDIHVHRNEV